MGRVPALPADVLRERSGQGVPFVARVQQRGRGWGWQAPRAAELRRPSVTAAAEGLPLQCGPGDADDRCGCCRRALGSVTELGRQAG